MPVLILTLSLVLGSGCSSIRRFHREGDVAGDNKKIRVSTAASVVLRATVVATAKAPVKSTRTGARMFGERAFSLVHGVLPQSPRGLRESGNGSAPGSEAFEAHLDRKGLPARSAGSVQFLVDGPSFFPAFHDAIDSAKESIDVQFYIVSHDAVAEQVAAQLKRKSSETPVRLLYDAIGSEVSSETKPPIAPSQRFKSVRELMAFMAESPQVKIRATSNPYFVSDHTKLALFDNSTAFIGGMNIAAEYRYTWHDMMERIEGPIVQQMRRVFDDHWKDEDWHRHWGLRGWFTRNQTESIGASTDAPPGRYPPLRMLLTDVSSRKKEVLRATVEAIRCAQKRIWIETPYFSSDEITAEVKRAVQRGVDVRVVIPGNVDAKFMKKVNAEELADLLGTHAKVYEYPGMTHLKATICDGWATVGSANYDPLSMRINRELNVATSDPATVQRLANEVFERDFRVSKQLTVEAARSRGGMLAEVLGDQL